MDEVPHRDCAGVEPGKGAYSRGITQVAWPGTKILTVKVLLLVLLACVGAVISRHSGLRAWASPTGPFASLVRDFGWWGAPGFTLSSAFLIAVGVPRLAFCPVAGAAFGFWGGLATSTSATMLAYFVSFLFIRGRLADRETPLELPAVLSFLKKDPGMAGVILTRLLPVPGLIGTAALCLSPIRKRTFLMGSLVGLVPEAVPLILLGAGLFEGNPKQLAWLGAGALALVVASLLLIRRLLRGYRSGAVSVGEGAGAEANEN